MRRVSQELIVTSFEDLFGGDKDVCLPRGFFPQSSFVHDKFHSFLFFNPSAAAAAAEEERCRNRGGKPRKKSDETLMKTNKLHRHVQEKEQCVPFLIKYALRYISGPYKTSSIFNVRTPPRPLFVYTGYRLLTRRRNCFHDQRRKEQRDYFHRLSRLFFHACPIFVITQIKTPWGDAASKKLGSRLPGLSHRDLRSGLMVCFFFKALLRGRAPSSLLRLLSGASQRRPEWFYRADTGKVTE